MAPIYDLIASMTLLAGVYLFMFGVQTFVIKDRRRLPHEAIKATTSMILGLFIFALWVVWIGKPMNSTVAPSMPEPNLVGNHLEVQKLLAELKL